MCRDVLASRELLGVAHFAMDLTGTPVTLPTTPIPMDLTRCPAGTPTTDAPTDLSETSAISLTACESVMYEMRDDIPGWC